MPPVSRIRLRVEERQAVTPCQYIDAGSRTFPLLRVTTVARVESATGAITARAERAIIDTGAWITAIETTVWQALDRAGLIQHLPFVPGATPSPALIGGHSSPYRLGRLWVSLIDLQPHGMNWLPAVPVIAQLLLDPNCILTAPILLGLHHGVLDGRTLLREPVQLPTTPMPPHHTTDCGAWYGQEWYLECA